jgi:hypothetical protein
MSDEIGAESFGTGAEASDCFSSAAKNTAEVLDVTNSLGQHLRLKPWYFFKH